MPNVWIGLATSFSNGRFAEGDVLLIYDHAPNSFEGNKIFAWFGPFDLTENQIEAARRIPTGVRKKLNRLDIASLNGPIAAYVAKAFDPTKYVDASEIPVIDKNTFVALFRNK
jgi:hypothetical protein